MTTWRSEANIRLYPSPTAQFARYCYSYIEKQGNALSNHLRFFVAEIFISV